MARASGLQFRDTVLIVLPHATLTAYLFRAPFEGTIIDTVRKNGLGCLQIDQCRIFTDWQESDRPASWKRSGHTAKPEADKIAAPPGTGIVCHPKGRWPTNMLLVHGPGCIQVGTAHVHGSHSVGKNPAYYQEKERTAYGTFQGHRPTTYVGENGLETIVAWKCQSDCPSLWLENVGGVSRFYPQFPNLMAAMDWLARLIGAEADQPVPGPHPDP